MLNSGAAGFGGRSAERTSGVQHHFDFKPSGYA